MEQVSLFHGRPDFNTDNQQTQMLIPHTVSFPGVAEAVHGSDLVIHIGPLISDSNTGGFTRDIKDANLISLGHAFCQLKDQKFDNVHFLPRNQAGGLHGVGA